MLALVASAVVRSPMAVGAACIAAAVTHRWGKWAGAAAALASLAAVLRFSAALAPPRATSVLVSLGALLGVAVLLPLLHARRARTVASGRSKGRAPAARGRSTPPRSTRIVSVEAPASEWPVENEVIERFLRDVRDALGADEVRLWEHDAGDDEPRTLASSNGRGWEAPLITNPPVESLVHWAVQQGMPANNYDDESAYFLAAPVGREGRFQGAIGLWAADRRSVSRERAKATLGGYATRLAILLDLLNDGRETRRYRGKAEKVVKAAERIQSNTEQVALLDAICETAVEISGATRAAFVLWSEPTGTGRVAAVSAPHVIAPGYVVASDSLVAMACRERQRFTIRESYRKSDFPLFGAGEPSRRVSSLAVVPIWRDVRTLGAICVEGDQTAQLTKVEGELLSLLSTNIAVALDNVSQLAIVTQQSLRDGLTGLANRRSFDERLRQHLGESDRFGQQTSLILLDVDHFKRINDGYGHDVGDRVLIAVAQAVATGVRSIDLCARYGGEELAVLLPQTHLQSAVEVAERLRRSIASIVLPTERGEVRVTASFGVASYPESVGTQDALFVAADRALYGAKHAGRNCVKPAMVKLPGTGS